MDKLLNKVIKLSIYLLVFLLPLFFLPFSFEAFEFNKLYLLFFLVALGFFAWLAKMVAYDKEIRFRKTPLDIFVLVFLFLAILSAIFSVDKNSSLFGFYGRFSDGLIGLLSLGVLYFLITNNVSLSGKPLNNADKKPIDADKKISINQPKSVLISGSGLIKTLMWSVFFVILFSYFSIFGVWAKLNSLLTSDVNISLPQVMLQRTFNPAAGSLEGLAVFLAVISVFLVGRIISAAKGQLSIINYLLLIFSFGLLVIIDFKAAWLLILVSLILFLAIALGKRLFKENVNKLLLPILITVLAATFLAIDTPVFQLPREQVLAQGTSWQVGLGAATENIKSGFLGSGIGTFHYDFAKFKPKEFNQNFLWQIRFDRPGSQLAEILGTMGFLGLLSYFLLVGFFLLISWLVLFKPTGQRLEIPFLMAFLALLIGQFVFYQNTILAFTFWLILGLSAVNWQKPAQEKSISFKDFPELSLVFSTLIIVLGLVVLGTYFFGLRFYLADVNFKNALGEERTARLEKAIGLNPYQAQYKIVLAREYLGKVLAETQKPAEVRDQVGLSRNVFLAISYSKGGQIDRTYVKGATELAPNRVAAWETLGMIYRDIQALATGALDWAIKSFEKAITLEPTNPVLYTELGKLYLTSAENEKARSQFLKAIELKSDYLDALIQEALIYERENNFDEAIRKMEELVTNYPLNIEARFQLGRLYFNQDRAEEAISQFEAIISIIPNHSNALYSLGVAYTKEGQKQKAISAFEKVLEINPGNQDVIQKLQDLKK